MMDRRVKERLVGATILVALIVLVVPELLSGPKPSSAPPLEQGLPATTREVNVDLATSQATPEPQGASASPAGAQAASAAGGQAQEPRVPGGAADGAASPPPGNEPPPPTVATLRAQGTPPALETAQPVPRSARTASKPAAAPPERRSAWAVQLGSFASRANADKLVRQLQASAAASVYVLSSGSGSSLRYRVRMGPLADRASAERAVIKLKAQGHPATIVTPSS